MYTIMPSANSKSKLAEIIKRELDKLELTWEGEGLPFDTQEASESVAKLMLDGKPFDVYGADLVKEKKGGEYLFPINIRFTSMDSIMVVN
jgi:hypothetical protein